MKMKFFFAIIAAILACAFPSGLDPYAQSNGPIYLPIIANNYRDPLPLLQDGSYHADLPGDGYLVLTGNLSFFISINGQLASGVSYVFSTPVPSAKGYHSCPLYLHIGTTNAPRDGTGEFRFVDTDTQTGKITSEVIISPISTTQANVKIDEHDTTYPGCGIIEVIANRT